ncbi:hypothetical protein GIY62_31820 [Burkholderia plantarii]|uniref:hypothetical protein n=1 Tax=Burkholderia plantarii TaxID=41899 RepID=UPI00272A4AF1|nr:hypothetical protein [Burkholderia plantarii]WLE61999.1 hypothetical protein GIY62_31820 [Burkholderia plantarii]
MAECLSVGLADGVIMPLPALRADLRSRQVALPARHWQETARHAVARRRGGS